MLLEKLCILFPECVHYTRRSFASARYTLRKKYMQVSESELKEFILDSGLVARKDVEAADTEAKARKQSIGDILVGQGALTPDSLRRIQAYVLGIPFVNLKDNKVALDVLSLIPDRQQ